jgi:thioredoxin-related protein
MKTAIIATLLFFYLTSSGQQPTFDCEKNLDQSPYFIRHNISGLIDSLQMDFEILKNCGQLDSIDCELLLGPMLGNIMIHYKTNDQKTTYSSILKSINAFKKTDHYAKSRDAIIASKILENKIVTVEEIEKDRELLMKAGLTPLDLDVLKTFIQSNTTQKMTYKEAFANFLSPKQKSSAAPPEEIEFRNLIDIENAIKTGKENNKKVLLYFSCYSCVNARKIENRILTDHQVKSILLEKFNLFIAYVDDKSEDKATNSTVGKKFSKLQSDNFKTNSQPYFCIISPDGKVLSEIGYTISIEEFIDFLNKGLK